MKNVHISLQVFQRPPLSLAERGQHQKCDRQIHSQRGRGTDKQQRSFQVCQPACAGSKTVKAMGKIKVVSKLETTT